MPSFPRLLWYLGSSLRRLNWDKKKLEKYQEKKLRNIIRYAQDFVPFYHELFKKTRISATDIRNLDDLSKLPIINKGIMRKEEQNRLVSSECDLNKLKSVTSSGSTGRPFYVYITGAEDDWRKAIYMRANISCGQKLRDRWAVISGPRHFHETTKIQRLLGIFAQQGISIYDNVEEQIRRVRKINPDILDGYSQSLLLLAKKVMESDIKDIMPRIIFGTAELVVEDERKFIENTFNAPFYDQFGCAEIDRSAWQCPEKIGYHLDVDSVITQFIDEEGNEVAPGEKGNIVYTSLFNYAMPLIRYSVGDVGQPIDEECTCDRVLPLMKIIDGRKDSFIFLPNNRVLPPVRLIWAMIEFDGYKDIEQFRIIQKKTDYIRFLIKKSEEILDEDVMAKKLIAHFRNALSVDEGEVDFDVAFVDRLPSRKGGKLASIVSEVNINKNSTN